MHQSSSAQNHRDLVRQAPCRRSSATHQARSAASFASRPCSPLSTLPARSALRAPVVQGSHERKRASTAGISPTATFLHHLRSALPHLPLCGIVRLPGNRAHQHTGSRRVSSVRAICVVS